MIWSKFTIAEFFCGYYIYEKDQEKLVINNKYSGHLTYNLCRGTRQLKQILYYTFFFVITYILYIENI